MKRIAHVLCLVVFVFSLGIGLADDSFAEEKKPIRFSVIKEQSTDFIKNVQIINLEMEPGAKFPDAKLTWDEIVWMKQGTLDFISADGKVVTRKKEHNIVYCFC